MTDLNCVFLQGRLTRDAEMSMTKTNQMVFRFSLAFSRSSKNEKGEWEDKASFIDCVFFSKANPMLGKGEKVFVKGYLQENTWTDKNNNTHRQMRLIAESIDKIATGKREVACKDEEELPDEPPF